MDNHKALLQIKAILDQVLPSEVKTVGKQDFTGYPFDALKKSLDLLDSLQAIAPLPAPLAVCHRAIARAYAETTKGPANIQTLTAGLTKRAPSDKANKLRDLIKGIDKE